MLKVIENKAIGQRDILIDRAKRIFSSIPQPANLKFLAAGLSGHHLKLVKEAIPRVRIHAIEPDEQRLHIMATEGPIPIYCELTTLDRFVSTFPARPSGSGNPHCDGHFVGADLLLNGPLSAKHLMTLMGLVADHRFVKPGYSTALGVTFSVSKAPNANLARAMLRSTPEVQSTSADQDPQALLPYLTRIMGEANPAITVEPLLHEKYLTAGNVPTFFCALEIHKPAGSPSIPAPQTRVETQHDGTVAIGRAYLPNG